VFTLRVTVAEPSSIRNREVGICVNVKEANVQETANAGIREQSNGTLDEEVTKPCSNAGEKSKDMAVIRKTYRSVSADYRLDKLQNICVPDTNYSFPTAKKVEKTIMISKVLYDFHFSRSAPQKSADDEHINILKNKLIK
jgi:hypothetical protein